MKTEKNHPAFPVMPIQDQFGRLVAPIAGMTKYEHVMLNIYIEFIKWEKEKEGFISQEEWDELVDLKLAFYRAADAADIYFDLINDEQHEKETAPTIIQ